jgi:hypothetical protein
MKMRMKMWGMVCVLMLVSGVSFGQSKQSNDASAQPAAQTVPSDGRHYQVVFVAQELEGGKVINSRRYETDMTLQGPGSGIGSIRTGSKIPLATGSYSGAQSQVQTQFTYIDVGVNLDFNHARLEGDRVFLLITAEISSAGSESIIGGVHEPIIRQNKWNSGVTVQLGKPTVIFSSDDVSSKRTMQIELTVTPMR